jgi:hypothetical protein
LADKDEVELGDTWNEETEGNKVGVSFSSPERRKDELENVIVSLEEDDRKRINEAREIMTEIQRGLSSFVFSSLFVELFTMRVLCEFYLKNSNTISREIKRVNGELDNNNDPVDEVYLPLYLIPSELKPEVFDSVWEETSEEMTGIVRKIIDSRRDEYLDFIGRKRKMASSSPSLYSEITSIISSTSPLIIDFNDMFKSTSCLLFDSINLLLSSKRSVFIDEKSLELRKLCDLIVSLEHSSSSIHDSDFKASLHQVLKSSRIFDVLKKLLLRSLVLSIGIPPKASKCERKEGIKKERKKERKGIEGKGGKGDCFI